MSYHEPAYPAWQRSGWPAVALGGGGLGSALVHLFIWRLIWRGGLAIWRIPTFGPPIDVVLGIVVLALIIVRSQRGPGWWQRRGGSSDSAGSGRAGHSTGGGSAGGDSAGDDSGTGPRNGPGPRDW